MQNEMVLSTQNEIKAQVNLDNLNNRIAADQYKNELDVS